MMYRSDGLASGCCAAAKRGRPVLSLTVVESASSPNSRCRCAVCAKNRAALLTQQAVSVGVTR